MTIRNLCPVCMRELPRFKRGPFCSRACKEAAS